LNVASGNFQITAALVIELGNAGRNPTIDFAFHAAYQFIGCVNEMQEISAKSKDEAGPAPAIFFKTKISRAPARRTFFSKNTCVGKRFVYLIAFVG
jgi:hypothetical protein